MEISKSKVWEEEKFLMKVWTLGLKSGDSGPGPISV